MISPDLLKKKCPLSHEEALFLKASRDTASEILNRKLSKKALIIGPCSIHHFDSALKFAEKCSMLAESVKEHFFLLMRVYIEKPRTQLGWKGFAYDPDLDGSNDIEKGIALSRSLMKEITKLSVPIATELLEPNFLPYFEDFITWGFIGSRTSSSQIHRQLASKAPFSVGFKNITDGALSPAINGIISARSPHSFTGIDGSGKLSRLYSKGNPNTHLVLRGSEHYSNIDQKTLDLAESLLPNCPLMIDCSHGNSQKNFRLQPDNFLKALELNSPRIIGYMMESFINEGKQDIHSPFLDPNTSVTDGCMGWEVTEKMVRSAAHRELASTL
ncbi:MAG: 3-deoxy-7-phosphoheptulonate synthase [Simkaniaceae bacterium]